MHDIIRFTYRPKKYRRTLKKHGIDFEKIKCLFYYPEDQIRVIHDKEHSEYEDRYMIMGFVPAYNRYIRVNYTVREDGVIRLITARKAKKKEVKYYFRDRR